MQSLRVIGLILFVTLLVGCRSSSSGSVRFARELLVPFESSLIASWPADELLVDQEVLEELRRLAKERGESVVAVLHVPQGIHPYLTLVVVESRRGKRAVATSMYWGGVMRKRVAEVTAAEMKQLQSRMTEASECLPGPVAGSLVGTVLVHWPGGLQTNCDAGWWAEESAAPWPILEPILDRSRTIYEYERLNLPGSQANNSLQQSNGFAVGS